MLIFTVVAALFLNGVPAFAVDAPTPTETTPTENPLPPKAPMLDEGGAGDLLITPTRIVFAGRERSAEIVLKNRGTKPATYRIGFIDMDVKENGEYVPTESSKTSAKSWLRYSPRQVSLSGGETQKVKLLVRKPANLADGEYRTHLQFQALPNSTSGDDVEAVAINDKVSVKLIPLVGVSIPVIVQHGNLDAKLSITAKREGKEALVTLNRSGARSVVGDVLIKQGSNIVANSNVHVLYPSTNKQLRISLPEKLGSEKLTVEFVELQQADKKPLASTTF